MEAAEPNRGRKCQQSHGDDMDAMDGQPRTFDGDAATPWVNGSAWAEVDDTFFRIVADVFPAHLLRRRERPARLER
jgi:hypothetical protein